MPTVPTLQVGITGGGGPRAANTIGDAGAQAGQRVSQAGQQLYAQGVRLQDTIDEARTLEADVQASQAVTDLLNNPETGYLSTRGGNAVDRAGAVTEELQKVVERAGSNLTNPRQQAMFRRAAEARVAGAMQRVSAHAAQQADEYKADMLVSRAGSFIQEAAAAPFDTKMLAVSTGSLRQTIADMGAMRGWSPEKTQAETLSATTKLHGAVISSMMSQERGQAAREYFGAHLDEIDPTMRDNFKKTVEQAAVKAESLDLSIAITDAGGSLADQRAALRTRYEKKEIGQELYDATDARLRDAFNMRKAEEQEGRLTVLGQAQDWYLKHPGASPLSMPAHLYTALKAQGNLDAAESMSNWGREGGGGGAADDVKAAVYVGLAQAAAANPEGFARGFDPRKYIGVLSPSQIDQLQKDAREGPLTDFADGVKLLSGDLVANGLDPSPTLNPGAKPDKADAAQANAQRWSMFTNAYVDRIRAARRDTGRRLTQEELRGLGLSMLGEVVLKTRYQDKSIFGGTNVKVMENRGKLYQFLGDAGPVAPVTRAGIIAGFKAKGVGRPTEDQIRAEVRRRALVAAARGGSE